MTEEGFYVAYRQSEKLKSIKGALIHLFDAGGPDGSPLPTSCYEAGPWQAPGTVAVRVEALRALAKAAGIMA